MTDTESIGTNINIEELNNININNDNNLPMWMMIGKMEDPLLQKLYPKDKRVGNVSLCHHSGRNLITVIRDMINNTRINYRNYSKNHLSKSKIKDAIKPFNWYVKNRLPKPPLNNTDISGKTNYNKIIETNQNLIITNNDDIKTKQNKNLKSNILCLPITYIQKKDLLLHYLTLENNNKELYKNTNKNYKSIIRFTVSEIKDTIKYIKQNGESISNTGTKAKLIHNIASHYNMFMEIAFKRCLLITFKNRLLEYIRIKKEHKAIYTWEMSGLTRNAYYDRSLCTNDIDPISCEEVGEIPDEYFIVIKEMNKLYGYDLRSIYGILNHNRNPTKYKNPLTQNPLEYNTYVDIDTRIRYLNGMKLPYFFEDDEEENTDNNLETVETRIINNINTIVHILNRNGYYISEEVVNNFRFQYWRHIYRSMHDIWFLNLSNEMRDQINENVRLNFIDYRVIENTRPTNAIHYITELFKIMMESQSDINLMKTVQLYVMISLCSVRSPISDAYPHLQNIFTNNENL
jgi:hypothetical protein